MTFIELNQLYLSSLRGRSCYQEYTSIYVRNFANWTEHPTRSQLAKWNHDHATTPSHTRKRLGYIRSMYNWAIHELGPDEEPLWNAANPTVGIKDHRTFSRERTMTHRELELLVSSLDLFYLQFRVVLTVLLTTGCRVGEAIKMEWTHIDTEAGVWNKPITKNGRPQRVPLPIQTCEALEWLRGSVDRTRREPARGLAGPLSHRPVLIAQKYQPVSSLAPSTSKYVFRGQYEHHLSRNAVDKYWRRVRTDLRMPDVRIHDFRRTVASRLLDQGEHERVIKAILNHYNGDVTSIYARASFDTQAKALQKLADGLFNHSQEGDNATWRRGRLTESTEVRSGKA
jgi:integrase